MERVCEEWAEAWQKIRPDYDKSVYETLSSPDNQEFLKLLRKYVSMLKEVKGLRIVENGFLPFGFRSLILTLIKGRSIEKIIYFLYHAIWRMLNFVLKIIGDDYQNPIYLVAEKH